MIDHETFTINTGSQPVQFIYEGDTDPYAPNAPQITINQLTKDITDGFGGTIYRFQNGREITISFDTNEYDVAFLHDTFRIKQKHGPLLPNKEALTTFL